jgi:pimeloyl-ACP methyl ester carboxylesterase
MGQGRCRLAGLALVALVAVSCGASSGSRSPNAVEGRFDVGGHELWITCEGTGSPAVVFDGGLGAGAASWSGIRPTIAASTRACAYDRAAIGQSPPRSDHHPVSVGVMADELSRLLVAARIDGPVVLVGHSYGGMIVRLVAGRHPDRVVGLVLVDAASEHELEGEWLAKDVDWVDGSTLVDRPTSGVELAAVDDLDDIPLAVLTQGQTSGQFAIEWSRFQAELARLSSNAVHVVARDSGHSIQNDAPDLVKAAIAAVLRSAREGCHARVRPRLPASRRHLSADQLNVCSTAHTH